MRLTPRQERRFRQAADQKFHGFVVLKLSLRNRWVRYLGDEAEQVALIALAHAARSYRARRRGPGGFRGFAYRVISRRVLSAALSFFRRFGQCPVEELDPPSREPEPADVVVRAEQVAAVERVLGGKVEEVISPADPRSGGSNTYNLLLKTLKALEPGANARGMGTAQLYARVGEAIRARLVAS
jgi:hypothetical protein